MHIPVCMPLHTVTGRHDIYVLCVHAVCVCGEGLVLNPSCGGPGNISDGWLNVSTTDSWG